MADELPGFIPHVGLDQVSWLLPVRWGFAASASMVDLRTIDPLMPGDRLWLHALRYWLEDTGLLVLLVLLGAVAAGFVRFRLRLRVRTRAG